MMQFRYHFVIICRNSNGFSLTMFERTTFPFGATIVMSKVALIAGSSQHGKALLASVG